MNGDQKKMKGNRNKITENEKQIKKTNNILKGNESGSGLLGGWVRPAEIGQTKSSGVYRGGVPRVRPEIWPIMV